MLDTSLACLTTAMLVGFIELSRAASGVAPWLLFAFLVTFLASLLMPPRPQATPTPDNVQNVAPRYWKR